MNDPSTLFDQIVARLQWMPDWMISLIILALAPFLANLLHRILFRMVTRWVSHMDLFWRALLARTEGPTRLAFLIVAVSFAASIAPLPPGWGAIVRQVLSVGFIALLGWIALTAFHVWMVMHLRRFKLDTEDNLLARKHVTQTRMLQRVANVLILVITASIALMTFDSVRQYGVSLLASAGAAGIIVGLALQPVLKNLIAGIQLAITQPIRIDDALIVEGEWGNVEEITSTYVVVRLWDWRRMILPLSYFIEKPFQNWTRENADLIGVVMLYLDHTAPVAEIRSKAEEIVGASPNWDKRVIAVQVTDFKQSTMEVRILASAGSAGRAFDLRCEIREKIIAFLQQNHVYALPRLRAELPTLSA
ncbi:MAG: mechanosensitive ion channel family protein [Ferrovibrio sp.]|uniref:mechanosensitive ion channel family protein n=1 Tax=Ferrovibrio sp. TaxID=1917215 RepID=UPI00260A0B59|nr:mechanosensitive ion channel family protein [Ferrovibrio sp.]MCW0232516.1 mechanosensitive ion channel family protein [Ferrovibrio sp.]